MDWHFLYDLPITCLAVGLLLQLAKTIAMISAKSIVNGFFILIG